MTPLPCSHGMPNAATCMDCMEDGPVATAPRWVFVGDPFRSIYPGLCTGCGDPIEQGETIRRADKNERTIYVHEGCQP